MTQIRNSKASRVWLLEIGIYLVFGFWYLEFEIKVTPCLEICWSKIDC
jgi:hypothetical protein